MQHVGGVDPVVHSVDDHPSELSGVKHDLGGQALHDAGSLHGRAGARTHARPPVRGAPVGVARDATRRTVAAEGVGLPETVRDDFLAVGEEVRVAVGVASPRLGDRGAVGGDLQPWLSTMPTAGDVLGNDRGRGRFAVEVVEPVADGAEGVADSLGALKNNVGRCAGVAEVAELGEQILNGRPGQVKLPCRVDQVPTRLVQNLDSLRATHVLRDPEGGVGDVVQRLLNLPALRAGQC